MEDPTEDMRRALTQQINGDPADKLKLVGVYGTDDVFETDELRENFEVLGFMAPLVVVKRKSDNKIGTLFFQHNPRIYFGFKADN